MVDPTCPAPTITIRMRAGGYPFRPSASAERAHNRLPCCQWVRSTGASDRSPRRARLRRDRGGVVARSESVQPPARACRRRARASRLRDAGAGRAAAALRRRAARTDPGRRERPAPGGTVPRHRLAGRVRRRAGAPRARVLAGVRAERDVLRQLLAPRATATRRSPATARETGRVVAGSGRARSSASTSRTRTTTAATSPSAPTGSCGSGSATAAPAATPRTARRTWTRCSARCSGSTSVARSRSRRSSRSGSATRGATASTGRPGSSGSATSARTASRRSTGSRGPARASSTSAGTSTRAECAVRGQGRSARAGWSSPSRSTRHGSGCSVTGGYVYRGPAIPRISAAATCTATTAADTIWSHPGAQAADAARRARLSRRRASSSFGEGPARRALRRRRTRAALSTASGSA